MTRGDITGLVLSYVYAFGMLIVVESAGKRLRWPQDITRKIIHIGAGMWVWGVLYFFDTWWAGVIPYTTFIVMNYVFYRRGTFEQMDDAESSPGTVYFALSIALLFTLLWRTGEGAVDRAPIAAAAAMAMTWGDALASLVGRGIGERSYTVFGHTRTWEGSAVMVAASFAVIFLTLWLVPGSAFSPYSRVLGAGTAVVIALPAALAAGLLEGISPAGLDNLTVPLGTALALFVLYPL